jgi:hypothetical protein
MAPQPPRRARPLIFLIGCGLGATSLAMNLTYAVSQSPTLADQLSLGAASALIEALSLTMPSLALDFSRRRQRLASAACTVIAAGAIALATWSNLDYIRTASADHAVSRSAVADTRTGLRSAIALAEASRAAISESRSVDEITAALARLRIAPWALAETSNCASHGSDAADRQCTVFRKLTEAKAAATHRDELDSALARDRTSLRQLPPIAPIAPSALRLILFALVPGALAGPVLMLARW